MKLVRALSSTLALQLHVLLRMCFYWFNFLSTAHDSSFNFFYMRISVVAEVIYLWLINNLWSTKFKGLPAKCKQYNTNVNRHTTPIYKKKNGYCTFATSTNIFLSSLFNRSHRIFSNAFSRPLAASPKRRTIWTRFINNTTKSHSFIHSLYLSRLLHVKLSSSHSLRFCILLIYLYFSIESIHIQSSEHVPLFLSNRDNRHQA